MRPQLSVLQGFVAATRGTEHPILLSCCVDNQVGGGEGGIAVRAHPGRRLHEVLRRLEALFFCSVACREGWEAQGWGGRGALLPRVGHTRFTCTAGLLLLAACLCVFGGVCVGRLGVLAARRCGGRAGPLLMPGAGEAGAHVGPCAPLQRLWRALVVLCWPAGALPPLVPGGCSSCCMERARP
jgi:hypothetical protein